MLGLAGAALAAGCGGSENTPRGDAGVPQAPVDFAPATHNFMNVTVGQTTAGVEFTITSPARPP